MNSLRHGEKGFTLIELVIIVSLLGILASVIIPNVGGFLVTANIAAANSEVAAVITASRSYYANTGSWPGDSDSLLPNYLDKAPEAKYGFDSSTGRLSVGGGDAGKWGTMGFTFNSANQTWVQ